MYKRQALLPVGPGHETEDCSVMSWGFNPYLTSANPFVGAATAVVDSVAKLVAAGCAPEDAYLTFQEYFEKLRDEMCIRDRVEYKREGFDMFEQMIAAIQEETLRRLFTVRLKTNEEIKRERVAKITGESGACLLYTSASSKAAAGPGPKGAPGALPPSTLSIDTKRVTASTSMASLSAK